MVPSHQPKYHMTMPYVLMKMKNVFRKLLWFLQWRVPPHRTAQTHVALLEYIFGLSRILLSSVSALLILVSQVTFFVFFFPNAISSLTPLCFHLVLKSAPRFPFPVRHVVLSWVKSVPKASWSMAVIGHGVIILSCFYVHLFSVDFTLN